MPFLKRVDSYINGYLVGPEDLDESHRMTREFIFFDTFKAQVRDFFRRYGLPTGLTDDESLWNQFVEHYAGVIEDGSLALHAETPGLAHIKQVTFTKGRTPLGEFDMRPFKMVWSVALLTDKTPDIDVTARPAQGGSPEMIGWSLHLRD